MTSMFYLFLTPVFCLLSPVFLHPSFQHLAGFVRPKQEIELVEINSNIRCEFSHLLFGDKILFFSARRLRRFDYSIFVESAQDVFVKYSIAAIPDVPQVMACLFITDSFYSRVAGEKIPALIGIVTERGQFITQAHPTFDLQVTAGENNITGPRAWITVCPKKQVHEFPTICLMQMRADTFDRLQSHTCACAGSEDAENPLFE